MGNPPAISVIVATYNGKYLQETLRSIATQTYSDFEVLVLDDANQVQCQEIVEGLRDQRFLYVGNKSPLRPALNHRKGIQLARGGRISILNHDDFWNPDVLERLSAALDRQPTAVAAFSRARLVNERGEFDEARTKEAWEGWACSDYPLGLIPNWFAVSGARPSIPAGPAALFRSMPLKSVIISPVVGGMYDAWIGYQIARIGPVYHENSAIGFWREHDSNLTQTRSGKRSAERIYFQYKLASDPLLPVSRRLHAIRQLPRAFAAWAKDSLLGERTLTR